MTFTMEEVILFHFYRRHNANGRYHRKLVRFYLSKLR